MVTDPRWMEQLEVLARKQLKSGYGEYLLKLLETEKIFGQIERRQRALEKSSQDEYLKVKSRKDFI